MKKVQIKLIGLAIFLVLAGAAWGSHLAGECGDTAHSGTDVPCKCGDTVTTSTVLNKTDPVTLNVCPINGLSVNAGMSLDLGGKVIRGSGGLGTGVLIGGNKVTITNGIVRGGFQEGVASSGLTSGSTISHITVTGNRFGIDITGDNNTIGGKGSARNICDRNTFGLSVIGDNNTLENNRCRANDLDGITVLGDNNTLLRNFAATNGRRGLGNGMFVSGSGNTLNRNQGRTNSGDGVFAEGGGNIPDGTNYGHGNGGVQCEIDGVGGDYC